MKHEVETALVCSHFLMFDFSLPGTQFLIVDIITYLYTIHRLDEAWVWIAGFQGWSWQIVLFDVL